MKRYRTPYGLKSWLFRGSWDVQERISLEAMGVWGSVAGR